MKESEAREILGMVKGATTQYPLDEGTIAYWLNSLKPLDAEIATKAVLLGTKEWDAFPAWSSFWEAYRAVRRNAQEQERHTVALVEGKRGVATPEWAFVWQWARSIRDPREDRAFPQQRDWSHPDNLMSKEDYEMLRDEWVAAGSPKELGKKALLPEVVTRS